MIDVACHGDIPERDAARLEERDFLVCGPAAPFAARDIVQLGDALPSAGQARQPLDQVACLDGQPTAGEVALTSPAIRSAARWFWWIAGLSLVNVVMFQTGSKGSFVVGLGITALSDVLFANSKSVGFVIDAIAIGFFLWMGSQASRGKLTAP